MGWVGQHRPFALGRFPPKQIDYRTLLSIDCFYHGIGELLPPLILMGIGLVSPYRQDCIEKQHSLIRPFFQVSVIGNGAPQIFLQLLIDILQRRGRLLSRQNGKTEAMGLIHIVIGILP